jgi:DNA-binding transcriptional ArsR family regulator
MLNTVDLPAFAEISSLEALRTVSDSWRHRILTLLIHEALTPSQIAERLNIARTRVYYHVDLLREHGFIHVVEERAVAAVTERTYRACAKRFKVDRQLLAATSSESEVNAARAQILEQAADDLRNSASRSDVLVARSFPRLSEKKARELRAALSALIEKYAGESESGEVFEMTLALFATDGGPV